VEKKKTFELSFRRGEANSRKKDWKRETRRQRDGSGTMAAVLRIVANHSKTMSEGRRLRGHGG